MNQTAKKLALGSAFALFASTTLTGVASAAQVDPERITFSATDNKDCTATFDVTNTTNSGMNEVSYWTGEAEPDAPEVALVADAAFVGGDGQWYAPWVDGSHPEGLQRNLEPVESEEVVDFSDVDSTDGSITVSYRMTGLEDDDFDGSVKTVDVTGCGESALGSLGSVDVFGSLDSGTNGSLGSLFGTNEE